MWTMIATCKKQNSNIFKFLKESITAHLKNVNGYMKDMLDSAVAAQRHEAVFFKYGASPTFAFKQPMGINEQDVKRFRRDWQSLHATLTLVTRSGCPVA